MARRAVWWWAAVGLGIAAIVAVATVPNLRLDAELTAARKEGLWTSAAEVRRGLGSVPEGQNAAPLIQAAIALGKPPLSNFERGVIRGVAYGDLDRHDRAVARAVLSRMGGLLDAWRKASERPRLDFGRRWEEGYALFLPELVEVKTASQWLIAAGVVGLRPDESFAAAARLSALARQEPVLVSQTAGSEMGELVLDLARQTGRGKAVERLLGPSPDPRRVLALELPMTLETMDRLREGNPNYAGQTSGERLRVLGPLGVAARTRTVHAWRTLWRDLGAAKDAEAAARAVDARMPEVERALGGYSPIFSNLVVSSSPRPGDFVRNFARFEAARANVRAGR